MFSLRPIAVACGSDYSTPPTTPSPTPTPALTPGGATSAVTIQAVAEALGNDAYAPAELNVAVGTSVTWTNNDDIPHTVVASAKLFKSSALDTRDKFSFTFATPGTYQYFCSLHPHMKGTIVVEVATGSNAAQ